MCASKMEETVSHSFPFKYFPSATPLGEDIHSQVVIGKEVSWERDILWEVYRRACYGEEKGSYYGIGGIKTGGGYFSG